QRNGEAGFSMFTLAPMGLVVFVVGIVYMLLLGHRLVPERPSGENLEQDFEVSDYLTEIEVPEGSGAVGMTLEELRGEARPVGGMEILQLLRDDDLIDRPRDDLQLRAGDRLAVRGDVDRIGNILDAEDFEVSENLQAERFKDEENVLLEVMLASDSDLEGHTLRDNGFSERWNCNVLAIRRSGELRHDDLLDTELQPGDVLLLHTTADGLNRIHELESQRSAPFITISEQRVETFRPRAFLGVAALLAAVVTLAATRILPISIGAPLAIVILMFSRFLGPREAYRAIDWRVVFLLAAALSFGRAMDASGLSGMVSGVLVDVVGSRWGPTAVVAALYLLTALCTEIMSNNAAAALLAPIALTLSGSMGVDPLPLLVTVAIAGSASFMTPVGYQTNTMVYSAGNYRFTDFTRVGAPLALALWLLATLLIPIFYPF
ncbi:MAG: SLC13 family permease, partial [Wenzhouxiangellaceae bacterium]|nr:SLC13 family permease [Wenzhouxiangellaceae bacterium]